MLDETTLSAINQLTVAALAVVACIALWRRLNAIIDTLRAELAEAKKAHIDDLKDINSGALTDLKARIMVLEDRAGVPRSAKYSYIPNTVFPPSRPDDLAPPLLNPDAD